LILETFKVNAFLLDPDPAPSKEAAILKESVIADWDL